MDMLSVIRSLSITNVQAATPLNVQRIDLPFNDLADVFGFLINVVLGVGIAVTIIFLILGGIQYITAKGDQKAAGAARDALTNAVIGFIVVIGAFTIRLILLNVIGGATENDLKIGNVVDF